MKFKRIVLENIRSYLHEDIELPDGSLLLSGDIGSGKSTVLLAIEFALFGLTKDLSGDMLLRNGQKHGSVELHLSIDNKGITIKRTLKKAAGSVTQDAGYAIVGDIKKELTAMELKQLILELLNYPKELLTKKSLIYRYTVYTPQEEMKHILFSDVETRINILRRVFGIDKYKRIKENIGVFNVYLRERMREFAGRIADLEGKKEERGRRMAELLVIEDKKANLNLKIETARAVCSEKASGALELEGDIKRLNERKKEFGVCQANLINKTEQSDKNKVELERLETQTADLEEWLKINKVESKGNIKDELSNRDAQLKPLESALDEVKKKNHELLIRDSISEKIMITISNLNVCLTCKQQVTNEHKERIINNEREKILVSKNERVDLESKEKDFLEKIDTLKAELDELKIVERRIELIKAKEDIFKERNEHKVLLLEIQEQLKTSIASYETQKALLSEEIERFSDSEGLYQIKKAELEQAEKVLKAFELELASYEQEARMLGKIVDSLNEEIEIKNKLKRELISLNELQSWLSNQFLELVDNIEKQIMLRVHYDFDSFFQKWFSMLVDDQTISMTLDEEFTPRVEQNGYEIEYSYLSGGEKTAAALAYRLALNQVINTIVSAIKTKDVLILDEPTDGFSNEQLDKLRDVLRELEIAQIILVSHEPKIESFVDKVIRFEKHEHVSGVAR